MNQLLLTITAIVSVSVLYAQPIISVGPNAGFGHVWMSGDDDDINNKYHPAGNVGVSFFYSSENHIGLGADLKFSIEGAKKENDNSAISRTTRLNYLRLPVQGIYFFRDIYSSFRPKISLGPSFGILVGGKEEIGSLKYDAKDRYKSFDLGLLANAGFHYNLVKNTWLQFDVSYYYGVLDVSETQEANRNRNISVNVGVAFGFEVGERSYKIR
jgi:outer membrane protein W